MNEAVPLRTTHPSLPSGEWTKVTVLPISQRRALFIRNDGDVDIRIELVAPKQDVPTLSTEGFLLEPGDVLSEDGAAKTIAHVYAYQESGSDITSLSVQEGR